MHGSRSKIPSKNLVRQRCAEGFNAGVKGLSGLTSIKETVHCNTDLVYLPYRLHTPRNFLRRRSLIRGSGAAYFLAVLNYVAKFDPVMINYLGSVSVKRRFLSHFAPYIHNELIHLLGLDYTRPV
jgi:hypothetical protein